MNYLFVSSVFFLALFIPTNISNLYDLEIQLAKLSVKGQILVSDTRDLCYSGYTFACDFLVDFEKEINEMYAYEWIFVDIETFTKDYKKSLEFQNWIKNKNTESDNNQMA